jgi:uncharacterized membrane protein YheB (UPF0754 family)
MERYQRGKIYKIVCRKTGKQYIGSTCKRLLSERLAGHNCDFKSWKKGDRNFVSSFSVIEENDYYIELVELVPCSSKDELLVRERFHIENNECVNKQVPLRTEKEWKEDNKKQIAEYKKKYNQEHVKEINEKNKKYYEEHKEQKKEYYEVNKKKFNCPCGGKYIFKNTRNHEKTIKHQNYLKEILGENAE